MDNVNKKKIWVWLGGIAVLLCIFIVLGVLSKQKTAKEEERQRRQCIENWAAGVDCGHSSHYDFEGMEDAAAEIIANLDADISDIYTLETLYRKLDDADIYSYNVINELKKLLYSIRVSYIQQNGIETVHTARGTGGFYDNMRDSHTKKVIGIQGSPLFDEVTIKYFGDFKMEHENGVRLDQFYQERSYSNTRYFFKDIVISNENPLNGKLLLSGNYLFYEVDNELQICDISKKDKVYFPFYAD